VTGVRDWLKPRFQDWAMQIMDDLRPKTIADASGDVLEIGFGTGRNLNHYGDAVRSIHGLDPLVTEGVRKVDERIERAGFPVERVALSANGQLLRVDVAGRVPRQRPAPDLEPVSRRCLKN
jgi:hypothetical protein